MCILKFHAMEDNLIASMKTSRKAESIKIRRNNGNHIGECKELIVSIERYKGSIKRPKKNNDSALRQR